jgi:hypothetical protein
VTKCVSRDSRSSFATISGQRRRRASAIAAISCGRSSLGRQTETVEELKELLAMGRKRQ